MQRLSNPSIEDFTREINGESNASSVETVRVVDELAAHRHVRAFMPARAANAEAAACTAGTGWRSPASRSRATAGAMILQKGGNAVDAACAMIAATAHDVGHALLGRRDAGAHLQPAHGKVIGINALGVAPTGATPDFYQAKGMKYPPEYGPLAAVTPGTPGGIMTMLAEYGKLVLKEVLDPAIQMADGFPIEAQLANTSSARRRCIKEWRYSRAGDAAALGRRTREAPEPGEIFSQPDLAATLRKLVEAEQARAAARQDREGSDLRRVRPLLQRRHRARDRARHAGRGRSVSRTQDLANWKVKIEEPVQHELQGHRGLQAHRLDAGPGDACRR